MLDPIAQTELLSRFVPIESNLSYYQVACQVSSNHSNHIQSPRPIDFLNFITTYTLYAFFYKNYRHIAFQDRAWLFLHTHRDTRVGIHHNISIQ